MMRALSLTAVAEICGIQYGGTDAVFSGVSIDSRKIKQGDLFVALKGERFDAHEFLSAVEQAGAVAAIVEKKNDSMVMPQLVVPDAVEALGKVAALNRDAFHGKIIGLTGSAGKTTTKEMIAAILAQQGNPLVTTGNLNNHIGVPLTLLRLSPENNSAVIEMGASALGEIRYLANLVKPDVALVTTVAAAHIEGFGSIENVAIGKAEIFGGLAADGVAVINLDNAWTSAYPEKIRHKTVTFSMVKEADVYASAISQTASGLQFVLHASGESHLVNLAFIGRHNVGNAVAAAACCIALGLGLDKVVAGLQSAMPYKGRLQSRKGVKGSLVIDDSYNANPASVRMAIDALMACKGEKILVLGDMAELGVDAQAMHAGIGTYAKEAGIRKLFATGNLSQATAESFGDGAQHFENWQQLADDCLKIANEHSVFLVKGSRSAGMDRVADVLAGTRSSTC